jgi:hypothetical protein
MGFDLEALQTQQLDPNVALHDAGARCVRVAESEYSSDVVHSNLQSRNSGVNIVNDPHLIQIDQQGTCEQLANVKGTFACSSGGLLAQRSYNETDCHSASDDVCTLSFAGMQYVLNSVNGDTNVTGAANGCAGPGSEHPGCDPIKPYELMMMIFSTECECQRFANLVKSISNSVLKAEGDWHFPELGERSVDSFRAHFCQNDLPVSISYYCSCARRCATTVKCVSCFLSWCLFCCSIVHTKECHGQTRARKL